MPIIIPATMSLSLSSEKTHRSTSKRKNKKKKKKKETARKTLQGFFFPLYISTRSFSARTHKQSSFHIISCSCHHLFLNHPPTPFKTTIIMPTIALNPDQSYHHYLRRKRTKGVISMDFCQLLMMTSKKKGK
ncbi:hypothetical protein Pfo_009046 [Paulownia fortunei]|nr:hypothetical protein Pfo_009046 [Paulownia fortunei]